MDFDAQLDVLADGVLAGEIEFDGRAGVEADHFVVVLAALARGDDAAIVDQRGHDGGFETIRHRGEGHAAAEQAEHGDADDHQHLLFPHGAQEHLALGAADAAVEFALTVVHGLSRWLERGQSTPVRVRTKWPLRRRLRLCLTSDAAMVAHRF